MTQVNGIDTEGLNATIQAVKTNPKLARCRFQSRTTWDVGFANRASVGDYWQDGKRVARGQVFHLQGDHPQGLLGTNHGPAAVETLLAAVGACISGGWATFGAAMGIPIEKLEVELEGDIDLQGFMGLDEYVRPGFQYIKGKVYVRSKASDEQLAQLKAIAERNSPVVDSLGVKVSTELVRI